MTPRRRDKSRPNHTPSIPDDVPPPAPVAPDDDEPVLGDDEVLDLSDEAADSDAASELSDVEPGSAEGPENRTFLVRREVDKRLDVYLQMRLKGVSRSRIQKLIDLGGVSINGRQPKASTIIRQNDVIRIILPPKAARVILPEPIPIHVLYEDDDYLIINKQAGLIVHPARSHLSGTLINGLAWRFKEQREAAGLSYSDRRTRGFRRTDDPTEPHGEVDGLSTVGAGEFRPGIVHRLDKNTTGVLVVAKNDEAHWAIARQFENRTTLKAYLAVVHGNFDAPGGVIEQPIGKHPTIREAFCVRHDSLGKPSVTLFRVREQYRGYALVELELKTGRTHQIRVHLSYMGTPIAGDLLYGGEVINEASLRQPPLAAGSRRHLNYAREKSEGQRLEATAAADPGTLLAHPALHAGLLSFRHPRTQQMVRYTAPLHEPMLTLVRRLRQQRIDAPVAGEGCWVDLDQLVPA